MLASLNRARRIIGRAFAFTFFGMGSLFLAFCLFPIIRLSSSDPSVRRKRTQRLIHKAFRVQWRLMRLLGLFYLEVENPEELAKHPNVLLVANHPSLLDVTILLTLMPEVDCIAKASLWHNPFVGGVIRMADYIANDDPEELISTCVERLHDGRSLLLFPEGTRSLPEGMRKFKRGAALIALEAGRPILPVTLNWDPPTLTKGEKWYKVPPTRVQITMRVEEEIDVKPFLQESRNNLIAARRLTTYLENYFAERVQCKPLNEKSKN